MVKLPPKTDVLPLPAVVGIRLKQLREALGYPLGRQKEFAEDVLGVGYRTWNNYETGDALIPIATAIRLKRKYRVPLDWLYDGDPSGSTLPFDLAVKLNALPD